MKSKSQHSQEYEVEQILSSKVVNSTKFYHVKWRGYSLRYATWEPASNLANAKGAILQFKQCQASSTPQAGQIRHSRQLRASTSESTKSKSTASEQARQQLKAPQPCSKTSNRASRKQAESARSSHIVRMLHQKNKIMYEVQEASTKKIKSSKELTRECPEALIEYLESLIKWKDKELNIKFADFLSMHAN